MTIYEETVLLAERLSVGERARLMEHLSAALRRDLEVEAFRQMPWQEFLARTEGILEDNPMERPPQLPLEDR